MVFEKVEEDVLRLLEVLMNTDSGRLVGKLHLYELSTSIGSGEVPPFRWCIWYIVRNFLIFVLSLASSCNVQFMIIVVIIMIIIIIII